MRCRRAGGVRVSNRLLPGEREGGYASSREKAYATRASAPRATAARIVGSPASGAVRAQAWSVVPGMENVVTATGAGDAGAISAALAPCPHLRRIREKRQLRGELVVLAAGARVRDAEAEIVGHDDGSEPAVLAARVQLKAQRIPKACGSAAAALE